MLYQLDSDPDSYYSIPVLAWGLREDGEVVGMVPWMEGLMPCHELEDPQQGHFVGYRDPETDEVFMLAPDHKVFELEHAAAYYDYEVSGQDDAAAATAGHAGYPCAVHDQRRVTVAAQAGLRLASLQRWQHRGLAGR